MLEEWAKAVLVPFEVKNIFVLPKLVDRLLLLLSEAIDELRLTMLFLLGLF